MEAYNLQKFRYRLALRERSGKPQHGAESRDEIGGLHRAVENHALFDAFAQRHHPGGAGESIAGAMMLETVASGIVVRVAAEVRQNEKSCLACILRVALDRFPDVGAETIGAADAINVKRVGAGVGDIDIVHGDPEKTRGLLPHKLTNGVDGELVGAGQSKRVSLEGVGGELQHHSLLLEFKFAGAAF